jgi:membrane-bound ClpP family serine protease
MLSSIALILIVLGVILIILSVFGITAGVTPYGTHGGVTLLVIGVILYMVLLLLPTAPV